MFSVMTRLRSTARLQPFNQIRMTLKAKPFCTANVESVPRPKMKIHHVLARHGLKSLPTIKDSCTLDEAIAHIHQVISAGVVVNKNNEVVGIYTAKDILRFLDKCSHFSDTPDTLQSFNIEHVMKPTERLIHCSPSDTVHRCREIMFQLKIRNMAVIEKGILLGIVNIKQLSDSTFDISDSGRKAELLENLAGRRGISKDLVIRPCKNVQAVLAHDYKHVGDAGGDADLDAEEVLGLDGDGDEHGDGDGDGDGDGTTAAAAATAGGSSLAVKHTAQPLPQSQSHSQSTSADFPPLQVLVGSYGLPHPFKKHPKDGERKGVVAPSRRHHGPDELATDMALCEGAPLLCSVLLRCIA